MVYQKEFQKVMQSKPHCTLGKNGITTEFINHINELFKKYKILKIKALKSVAHKNNIQDIADQVSNMTNSFLLDVRGKIFIISKKAIKKNIE